MASPAHVSLLTLHGRQVVAMVYGAYQVGFLKRLKGQVDLVYWDGTFVLSATMEMPDDAPMQPTRFLGVDVGIVSLATDSDGNSYTGAEVEAVRQRCATHRKTYQATHTKAAKRRLKKLAGAEARFRHWVNHHMATRLVAYAQDTKAALVLEDLTHIRDRMTGNVRAWFLCSA